MFPVWLRIYVSRRALIYLFINIKKPCRCIEPLFKSLLEFVMFVLSVVNNGISMLRKHSFIFEVVIVQTMCNWFKYINVLTTQFIK